MRLAKFQDLVRYWGTDYDWRKVEAKPNALPLIVTHGWPGSVLELVKVIGPLTDPPAYGGRPEDAFDVVIPSMPGYGFSAKPTGPGRGPDRIARTWAVLMNRLGYKLYVAQGGDWGSIISDAQARQAPPGLLESTSTCPATVPPEVAMEQSLRID